MRCPSVDPDEAVYGKNHALGLRRRLLSSWPAIARVHCAVPVPLDWSNGRSGGTRIGQPVHGSRGSFAGTGGSCSGIVWNRSGLRRGGFSPRRGGCRVRSISGIAETAPARSLFSPSLRSSNRGFACNRPSLRGYLRRKPYAHPERLSSFGRPELASSASAVPGGPTKGVLVFTNRWARPGPAGLHSRHGTHSALHRTHHPR